VSHHLILHQRGRVGGGVDDRAFFGRQVQAKTQIERRFDLGGLCIPQTMLLFQILEWSAVQPSQSLFKKCVVDSN